MAAQPGRDGPVRAQLSALRSLLSLSRLLSQQEDQATILNVVANAVGSLGPCRTGGIFLDGRWQPVQVSGRETGPVSLPGVLPTADDQPAAAGSALALGGVPWSWAYSLSGPNGPAGYLVVGAEGRPAEGERFLLRVLAQQAGVVLAKAQLHRRERDRAAELLAAHRALLRSVEIHDRLTRVAVGGEGQQGIVRAVFELTGLPAAIEDRFGHLLAWAGPGRSARRSGWSRWPWSAAFRPGSWWCATRTGAGDAERMAIEHATTVLAMELARRQSLAQNDGCGPAWCSTWLTAWTGRRC